MSDDVVKYRGVFLFPKEVKSMPQKVAGLLYKETSGNTIIEVFDRPEGGNLLEEHHNIVWGEFGGEVFTFFDVHLINYSEDTTIIIHYSAKYAIKGRKMASIQEKRFNGCQIRLPNLIHWICTPFSISCAKKEGNYVITDGDNSPNPILQTDLLGTTMQILLDKSIRHSPNSVTYQKDCLIKCDTEEKQSIEFFLKRATEISRFFSLAMLWKQDCYSLELFDNDNNRYPIWLSAEKTNLPRHYHLFSFQYAKDKIPLMLQKWIEYNNELQPMVKQLLYPLSYADFDYIDFLRFAHALEGLQKRFASTVFNEKGNYTDRIKNLKEQFQGLKIISECGINEDEIKETRHKYTHLGEDDVEEDIPKDSLYLLTLKCKVLLACSVLLVLGLTKQEIDDCTHRSELKNIVNHICAKENREIRF